MEQHGRLSEGHTTICRRRVSQWTVSDYLVFFDGAGVVLRVSTGGSSQVRDIRVREVVAVAAATSVAHDGAVP